MATREPGPRGGTNWWMWIIGILVVIFLIWLIFEALGEDEAELQIDEGGVEGEIDTGLRTFPISSRVRFAEAPGRGAGSAMTAGATAEDPARSAVGLG